MHKDEESRKPERADRGPSHAGTHAARRNEPVQSRSADPGQSSYGGFANQDPRFQRQQLGDYSRGQKADADARGRAQKKAVPAQDASDDDQGEP
ncbi:hypothetical protein RE432_17890 [Pusillimonas sp. SM2304]|uniref:hypothetical protein n=1 Tax=Pusillimonas sp. SM2304 TaxID=3073241 RepID=UPI0028757030|nr:hypothetical protein [Pusillimonas sp. SM2304]MDS1142311.1 hypothetical protein [Pusillimonas sp. SM2304]